MNESIPLICRVFTFLFVVGWYLTVHHYMTKDFDAGAIEWFGAIPITGITLVMFGLIIRGLYWVFTGE